MQKFKVKSQELNTIGTTEWNLVKVSLEKVRVFYFEVETTSIRSNHLSSEIVPAVANKTTEEDAYDGCRPGGLGWARRFEQPFELAGY